MGCCISVPAGLDVVCSKVVLWVMQRRGYLVRLKKRQNFFHTLLFCSKADFRSANLTSEAIVFNEIVG